MLILTRKIKERVRLKLKSGGAVLGHIGINRIGHKTVGISFDLPDEIQIVREEIDEEAHAEARRSRRILSGEIPDRAA